MTDTDRQALNERIALRRGWKRAPEVYQSEGWIDPDGIEFGWVQHPPDFTREWNHAGPLLVEMVAANVEIEIQRLFEQVACDLYMRPYLDRESGPEAIGDTLTEAIALAYDAWEEGKE